MDTITLTLSKEQYGLLCRLILIARNRLLDDQVDMGDLIANGEGSIETRRHLLHTITMSEASTSLAMHIEEQAEEQKG